MKVKKFHYPIFGFWLCVVDTDNIAKFLKKNDINIDYSNANLANCFRSPIEVKGSMHDCIFIGINTKHPETTEGTVCHEAVHAGNFMLEKINHITSYHNDEVQANLIEDIFNNALTVFKAGNE